MINRMEMFKLLGEGKTQVQIAKKFGVSQAAISLSIRNTKCCPNCGYVLNK